MLPPGEDVHGGRVDFLNEAHAPALHFRARYEHAVVEGAGGANRSGRTRDSRRSKCIAGREDIGKSGCSANVRQARNGKGAVLSVILAVFTEQNRSAEREPS